MKGSNTKGSYQYNIDKWDIHVYCLNIPIHVGAGLCNNTCRSTCYIFLGSNKTLSSIVQFKLIKWVQTHEWLNLSKIVWQNIFLIFHRNLQWYNRTYQYLNNVWEMFLLMNRNRLSGFKVGHRLGHPQFRPRKTCFVIFYEFYKGSASVNRMLTITCWF